MKRQPHAVIDLPSRRWKSEKILRLLGMQPRAEPWRILEIGTGTGGIAHCLGTNPSIRCEVDSVDVVDLRLQHDGYRFRQVIGTALPFADANFDVVISNHVIEHVGDRGDQLAHLLECRRVLAPAGRGYLAVPNRWMLVEPHFRLPFLSWLPRAWRSPYLQLTGRGAFYDCEPLTQREIEALFMDAGLRAKNASLEALHQTLDIEGVRTVTLRCVARVPDPVWQWLLPWFPTLVYGFGVEGSSSATGIGREVPAR